VSTLGWTILVLCVIALVVALAFFVRSGGRRGGETRALRRRFGPEYDRAVEQNGGDQHAAERKLAEIARRRDDLDIRPLEDRERAEYSARWDGLQAQFVDDPAEATRQADVLIADVMHTRGYPRDASFDERAELISADRPDVVGPYRKARADAANRPGGRGTEELRSAFVHYRELFAWLVDGSKGSPARRGDRAPALSGTDTRDV